MNNDLYRLFELTLIRNKLCKEVYSAKQSLYYYNNKCTGSLEIRQKRIQALILELQDEKKEWNFTYIPPKIWAGAESQLDKMRKRVAKRLENAKATRNAFTKETTKEMRQLLRTLKLGQSTNGDNTINCLRSTNDDSYYYIDKIKELYLAEAKDREINLILLEEQI